MAEKFKLDSDLRNLKGGLFGDIRDIKEETKDMNGAAAGAIVDPQNVIVMLSPAALEDYKNHPYKVQFGGEMDALEESIRVYGIHEPLLVRQISDGKYELIAGHRRKAAAIRASLSEVPCRICSLSDDEAAVAMVDSNLHRAFIYPSELVLSVRVKYEALVRLLSVEERSGQKTRDVLGKKMGMTGRTIQRFLSIAELPPAFLDRLDRKMFNLGTAYLISQLHGNTIGNLIPVIDRIDNENIRFVVEAETGEKADCERAGLLYGGLSADMVKSMLDKKRNAQEKMHKFALPELVYSRINENLAEGEDANSLLLRIVNEWLDRHSSESH